VERPPPEAPPGTATAQQTRFVVCTSTESRRKAVGNRPNVRCMERTLLLARAKTDRQGPRSAQLVPVSRKRPKDGPTGPLWGTVLCLSYGRKAPTCFQDNARAPGKPATGPREEAYKVMRMVLIPTRARHSCRSRARELQTPYSPRVLSRTTTCPPRISQTSTHTPSTRTAERPPWRCPRT